MDTGLLIVRLVIGLAFAAHGAQKLFGWFGGYGLKGTGGFFEGLGFRPGTLFAAAAGTSELVAGLLIAAGFLGPVGPALVLSVMTVAILSVHVKNGFFQTGNGMELNVIYSAAAASLAFAGYGAYSIDAIAPTVLNQPLYVWIVLAIGVLGGLANLAARRAAPAQATTAH